MEKIQLLNTDCLEAMSNIPDASIDMILTDPPYGVTKCKWDSVIPFDKMWEQVKRIIKPNGAIVLFGSEPFSSTLRVSNIKQYKYDWIWEKESGTGFAISKRQPLRKHELISVFYKRLPFYDSQGDKFDKPRKVKQKANCNVFSESSPYNVSPNSKDRITIYTHKTKHSILRFSRDRPSIHPTQKPVALMEYLVRTYTKEGEHVLDFTMGSGTTGVACVKSSRCFTGIELDIGHFNIAKERIQKAQSPLEDLF